MMQQVASEALADTLIQIAEPGKRTLLKKCLAMMSALLKMARKALFALAQAKTWKMKRTWIATIIGLRLAYQFMNEYGMNPFKKSLKDDHVFLTGAGSGIGQLMAVKFGKMGCKLSLSDINMAGLEKTKALCEQAGVPAANINIFICDVSKRQSISEGAQKASAAFGTVTILINNAGIVSGKTLMELSDGMIDKTMQVNTISHLHTIREFLPGMIAKKRGHIVSIASMAGLTTQPGLADYNASKWGAVAIDEAVRLEIAKNGHAGYIKTTCVCPYFIDTGMFEGTKNAFPFYLLQAQEVVDRIVAAIQQEEPMVVVPWRGNMVFLAKLLPTTVSDKVYKAMGVQELMSDFVGRK